MGVWGLINPQRGWGQRPHESIKGAKPPLKNAKQSFNFNIMHIEDTIVAISTPPGEGGIGIVRLSGARAVEIAEKIFISAKGKRPSRARSHSILYGAVVDPESGRQIDEVLLSVMRAPQTYTLEDIVEINCHGGSFPLRRVLEVVLREGARLAEPGEYTRRAFLNGRIDLSQAEAVLDLIRAKSEEAERAAMEQLKGGLSEKIKIQLDAVTGILAQIEAWIDFPEEELGSETKEDLTKRMEEIGEELAVLSKTYEEGRLVREGLKTAIVGRPNVGKSSLLNALLGEERAIVTDTPGTTRDVVSEYISIGGYALKIMDTAGIRASHEMAEKEGVRRSLSAMEGADLVICVLDGSMPLKEEDKDLLAKVKGKRRIIALNKSDLPQVWGEVPNLDGTKTLPISAKTGEGIPALKGLIKEIFASSASKGEAGPGVVITNLRHKVSLDRGAEALFKAKEEMAGEMPLEIVSIELREALRALGEIVGAVSTEDILARIFSEFCIGK
jgi:tRNA modification GTPase